MNATLEAWCRRYPRSAKFMRAQAERERIAAEAIASRAVINKQRADFEARKMIHAVWEKILGGDRSTPIVLAVAEVYELDPPDILDTPRGPARLSEARAILCYLLMTRAHMTYSAIAAFIHRDRASVHHAVTRARTHWQAGIKKCLEALGDQ